MKNIIIINNNLEKNNLQFVKPLMNVIGCPEIHYTEITLEILEDHQGILLSGTPLSDIDAVKRNVPYYQWLKDTDKAVLGICAGHQIIAKIFGSRIIHKKEKHKGMCKVFVDYPHPILDGCSKSFIVYHLHMDVVVLPKVFNLLVHGHNSEVELMKHQSKPIWGVQFHPERTKKGQHILHNFLQLIQ
jgi:GMP synthase (glutamine-hydrolysing)